MQKSKRLEKERGKEDTSCPPVILSFLRARKSGRKGWALSVNIDYFKNMARRIAAAAGQRSAFFGDHYERKAKLCSIGGMAHDVKIMAKRYKCRHCRHLFGESIERLKPTSAWRKTLRTSQLAGVRRNK